MNKILTLILSSIVLLPTHILAVDANGNYAVWGVGKKSCFSYQQATAANEVENYKNYIKGFFTAYNIFTEKTYSISREMNENQILEWIQSYCQKNPLASFESTLINFTFEHYDKRLKSSGSNSGR